MSLIRKLSKSYISSFAGLPRGAWILSSVVLINRSGSMVLFFMSLYLTKALGYSVTDAGIMITLYGLGAMAGSFLGGWLSDVWGVQKTQVVSLVLSGIGLIGLGYLNSLHTIGIMMFFMALVSEALRPANASAIAQVCPPRLRARCYGLNRMAVNIGVTIGPAIGGLLATFDYIYIFWVDGITCLIAAFFLEMFYSKGKIEGKREKDVDEPASRSPYRDYTYLWFLLILFLMGIVFAQIFSTWPLFFNRQNGFSEDMIGLLLAFNAIFVAIVEMPVIHRLEKKDPVRVMAVGALFFFLGFSILPMESSYLFALFSVLVWSIGEILIFPIATGFVANRTGSKNLGKYMGLYNLNFSFAIAVGPLAGSWIYDNIGPDQLWYMVGVVGFFALGAFKILDIFIKKEFKSESRGAGR